jgi:hypothetical protein
VLKRVEIDDGVAEQIKMANADNIVDVYAASGLWYNAIESLSEKIDKVSSKEEKLALHHMRANLLEQVKLPQIAALDRTVE